MMKRNVIIIVIDALSKWYIDSYATKDGFFENLKNSSYCADNMYSSAPFTEAALRGFWTEDKTLTGKSYLSEVRFDKPTIFELFRNNGYYIYLGELVPFFNYRTYVDNNIKREKSELRGFEHIWRGRISYFINLFDKKKFSEKDVWKLQFILDEYFYNYKNVENINKERIKYNINKKEYIYDILIKREQSSFFQNQDQLLLRNCRYRNTVDFYNQRKYIASTEELKLVDLVRKKNIEFLFEMNKKFSVEEFIEHELNGTTNRCINSNNNILSHMRGGNEGLPKLKTELEDFLEWHDETEGKRKRPFFAYIHNYDFHFPERFMNYSYKDIKNYEREIKKKIELVKELKCINMSVSKQLSIQNIEQNLKIFWRKLEERNIFQSSYVILTADHGISNFMYPVDKKKERWNYTKSNFQIPFYLCANNIIGKQDNYFRSSRQILPTLAEMCHLEKVPHYYEKSLLDCEKKEEIFAMWINGVPDLDSQKIKLGVRNNKYSVTCEAYVTQFCASANFLGVYNLEEDPDETVNLDVQKVNDKEFDKIYIYLKEKWFENILEILSDKRNKYEYWKTYSFIIENKNFFQKLNRDIAKFSIHELLSKIESKKIICFGAGSQFVEFMCHNNIQNEIKEIWDNDVEKQGKFMLGHPIYAPHAEAVTEDVAVIVTSRYEMEIVNQLYKMGIKNFYLCGAIC